MSKRVAILGSTGSIGTQALDILKGYKEEFQVVALSAHTNISLLREQVEAFGPEQVTITDTESYHDFLRGSSYDTKVNLGIDGIKEMISDIDADIVLIAIVG